MKDAKDNLKKAQSGIRLFSTVLKFAILIALIVLLPLYVFFFHHEMIDMLKDFDTLKAYFFNYREVGAIVYISAQVVQIIICIIPGQELQVVAGLLYGIPIAFILSIIGAAIGTTITFYLSKILGRDAIRLFFGDDKIDEYTRRINGRRGIGITFLIYLIPGLPKDAVSYFAGLTDIRFSSFLLMSLVGRSPAMFCSILLGGFIVTKNYVAIAILCGVVVIAFVLGIIFRNRIMNSFDKAYGRIVEKNNANMEKHKKKREGKREKYE